MKFLHIVLLLINFLFAKANESYQSCVNELCGSAKIQSNLSASAWKTRTESKFLSKELRDNAFESLVYRSEVLKYTKKIQQFESVVESLKSKIEKVDDQTFKRLVLNSAKENLLLCKKLKPNAQIKDCFPKYQIIQTVLASVGNSNINEQTISSAELLISNELNLKKSVILSYYRSLRDVVTKNFLKLQNVMTPPFKNLSLADYIIYKVVSAEDDVLITKKVCEGVPQRMSAVEKSIFEQLKKYYSPEFILSFKDYYKNTKTRFGNCSRISLEKLVENTFFDLQKTNLSIIFSSEDSLFNILAGQATSYPFFNLESEIEPYTSKFASEFLVANTNGEFYFDKKPAYSYIGNFYLQPGFFFEETYVHELGHVFEYFLKNYWIKNNLGPVDADSYSKILKCLEERNPKAKDQNLSEDLADWFSSVMLTYGTWEQKSRDFCSSFEIKDNQFAIGNYIQSSGKHSPTIFRLLQQRLQHKEKNKTMPLSCNRYLEEQIHLVKRIDPCL